MEQTSMPVTSTRSRRFRSGKVLPAEVQSRIRATIERVGKKRVAESLGALDPAATEASLGASVDTLMRESAHKWSKRIYDRWLRLDRRGVDRSEPVPTAQKTDRAKEPDPTAAAPVPAPSPSRPQLGGAISSAPSPAATTNEVLIRFLEQQNQMMQSQGQMLTHLVMTLGGVQPPSGTTALSTPARPAIAEPKLSSDPEPPPPTEFKDMSDGRQRAVLNSMHHRYASVIKFDGTEDSDKYKEAWNISYEYFERQTGIQIRNLASAESDATGHRCRPLDIIFARGLQVRFYDVVRSTWER